MPSEPKVVIVGTGGTIAGRADSATNLAYTAGQLSVADLLEVIPDLANVAQISGQNLFSLNSKDMGPAQWQLLARTISEEAVASEHHPYTVSINISKKRGMLELKKNPPAIPTT